MWNVNKSLILLQMSWGHTRGNVWGIIKQSYDKDSFYFTPVKKESKTINYKFEIK